MRTKRAPCRARGMKGGDGFKAANEAAMAAEAAHACADHRATSFGALRGRAGGLIAPERVACGGDDVESSGNCGLSASNSLVWGPLVPS